jgi:hypothetical protein
MSEFQYYDFRAIDRPLNDKERQEISSWSSRSKVSARRAIFSYSYGDFRKNFEEVVAQYFDMGLYFTNWGTKHIVFRFKKEDIDYKAISLFDIDGSNATGYTTGIEIGKKGDFVTISIEYCEEGGGDWIDDDDNSLDDFLPLRDDILRGDYRSLFVFWLNIAYLLNHPDEDEDDYEDEEDLEMPPIPANLKQISDALQSFMDYYGIDDDLIAAAAEFSADNKTAEPNFEHSLLRLDEKEKNDWLLRLLKGETRLEVSLKKRLLSFQPKQTVASKKVKMSDIFELTVEKERERKAQAAIDAQKALLKRMNNLKTKQESHWSSAEHCFKSSSYKQHETAAETLKELYEMALFFKEKPQFMQRFREVVRSLGNSKAKIERLRNVRLPVDEV